MAPAERKAVRISRAPEAASSRAKHASASEARESAIAASNRPSSSAIEVAQLISAADGITSDVSSEWTEVTEGPARTARSMSVPKSAWSPASSAASPNRAASASTAMRGSASALISGLPRRRPLAKACLQFLDVFIRIETRRLDSHFLIRTSPEHA